MATALISCLQGKKSIASIIASGTNAKSLRKIKIQFKIRITAYNKEAIKNSDIVFICVKPQDIDSVLNEIKHSIKGQLIVSIVAGISLRHIEGILKNKRIIRVMPNINCIVSEMAAGFCAGKYATNKDIKNVAEILDYMGASLLLREDLLDAVTAISGSGPAFFAYFIKAFEKAGVRNGLSKEAAFILASKTAFGTAKLLIEKRLSYDDLIRMVASKKGTTSAGMNILQKNKVNSILIKTINAAIRRGREIRKGK